jgi:hypothetical protein
METEDEMRDLIEKEEKQRRFLRDLVIVMVAGFGAGFLLALLLAWAGAL